LGSCGVCDRESKERAKEDAEMTRG
jgi:hypothetical protein